MKEFKQLAKDYREFVTNVLVSEDELFGNYKDQLAEHLKTYLDENNELEKYVEKMIIKDILYDFLFNIKTINNEIRSAYCDFDEEYSKVEILKIYKKAKELIKDIYVEEIEKEIE